LFTGPRQSFAKKLFAFHGIRSPFFATYTAESRSRPRSVIPLIVKTLYEDGSIGIDAGAFRHISKRTHAAIEYVQDEFDSPA